MIWVFSIDFNKWLILLIGGIANWSTTLAEIIVYYKRFARTS